MFVFASAGIAVAIVVVIDRSSSAQEVPAKPQSTESLSIVVEVAADQTDSGLDSEEPKLVGEEAKVTPGQFELAEAALVVVGVY